MVYPIVFFPVLLRIVHFMAKKLPRLHSTTNARVSSVLFRITESFDVEFERDPRTMKQIFPFSWRAFQTTFTARCMFYCLLHDFFFEFLCETDSQFYFPLHPFSFTMILTERFTHRGNRSLCFHLIQPTATCWLSSQSDYFALYSVVLIGIFLHSWAYMVTLHIRPFFWTLFFSPLGCIGLLLSSYLIQPTATCWLSSQSDYSVLYSVVLIGIFLHSWAYMVTFQIRPCFEHSSFGCRSTSDSSQQWMQTMETPGLCFQSDNIHMPVNLLRCQQLTLIVTNAMLLHLFPHSENCSTRSPDPFFTGNCSLCFHLIQPMQ